MRLFFLFVLLAGFCNQLLSQRICAASDYQQSLIKMTPSLSQVVVNNENFIRQQIANSERVGITSGSTPASLSIIRIPVVVHVLYNGAHENISDEQIQSQIAALNRDFRKSGGNGTQSNHFNQRAADTYIEFSLAAIDPNGYSTTGIMRKRTSILMFGLDDRIKFSVKGGDDAWDPTRYLNIWVGNTAGAIIGYASVVGGPKERDGVVIRYDAFGTTGRLTAPYNQGRTAVHEIGHWLGLYHIWGDKFCGDDHVDDTPPQQAPSRGCPSGTIPSLCNDNGEGKMYMNFMDLTDDGCMTMFTYGQRERMRALFAENGPRHSLLFSDALTGTPREEVPTPEIVNAGSLIVYPNPVRQVVNLELPDESFIGKSITVYNMHGQALMLHKVTKRTVLIQAGRLQKGLYLIKVEGRNGFVKFFKE